MGLSTLLLRVASVVLVTEYVWTQEMFDVKHKDTWGHLKKVPRKFEVRSENAILDFKKYINDIQDLIAGKNLTVIYKVKVDVFNDLKRMQKRKMSKKLRSKKYNIPLKKQSMKLSNFEVLLRKLAEENGQRVANYEQAAMMPTPQPEVITTKQIQKKFHPIIRIVKTNYTKIVKPVRNRIITLTV